MKIARDDYPAGISRAELARLCSVSPAAITILFRPTTRSTRLKARIHKILGLAAPTSTPALKQDDLTRRLQRALAALGDNEEAREHIVKTAEILAATASPPPRRNQVGK